MKIRVYLLALVGVLLGCAEASDKDLSQAMRAVESMASTGFLNRSCYSTLYPNGKPSDYVSYLFSSLGTAEWPPTESPYDVLSAELKQAGKPVFPEGVSIQYQKPDPAAEKQIVVRSDDVAQLVIYEAYLKGTDQPVVTHKRQIKVTAPTANPMCESNLQMGASAEFRG